MCRFASLPLCLLLVSACQPDQATAPHDELTIFAASSLTDAFQELADAFAKKTGDKRPTLAFAGSQVLRLQLAEGAKADVFASANDTHVRSLVDAGHVFEPTVFAENELVVIVPRSNPASLERFIDLPKARRIVVGAPEVPIGTYTRELFERAGSTLGPRFASDVRDNVVSQEPNVRLVRAKVELGEADAAIVYRTDVSPGVRTIAIPPELQVRARYHAGFVGAPPHSPEAVRWIAFLKSPEGRLILARHGFLTP